MYRRTITWSHIVSTDQSRLRIPSAWSAAVRAFGLIGGSVSVSAAEGIFAQSAPGGAMGWNEFLEGAAAVGASHGVAFKVVADRVMSVAAKTQAKAAAAAAEQEEQRRRFQTAAGSPQRAAAQVVEAPAAAVRVGGGGSSSSAVRRCRLTSG